MRFIEDSTANGMRYATFGSGERRLVVLPGLSDGLATVRGKAALLMPPYLGYLRTHRIYIFSRRDDLAPGATTEDMARDQLAACDELGLDRFSVLGVSQGGMIAQSLALLAPERVEKLVLAVTAPRANETIRENVARWLDMTSRGSHAALMRDTAERSYSEAYLRAVRKTYPFLGIVGRPRDYRRFAANCGAILSFDASDALGGISCPTLIIGGEKDMIVGADAAYELHGLIAGSELYVYPGLGHGLYEESGDFYRRVFAFIDR